jgi:CRISPR-associated protein Cas2
MPEIPELTSVKLDELKLRALDIMEIENDSLIIFQTRQEKWLEKEIVGKERSMTDNII